MNPSTFPPSFQRAIGVVPGPRLSRVAGLFTIPALAAVLSISNSTAAPPPDSPYGAMKDGLYGQVRTRLEFDQKVLLEASSNEPFLNSHLRTRLGYVAVPSEMTMLRIEAQDSRFYGSQSPLVAANPATASIADAEGLDLLQAYALVQEGNFQAALGRQKMSLGSGRYLSTLEWHPNSRSFDGVSFNYFAGPGHLTGLTYLVRDISARAIDDRLLLTGLFYNHAVTPGLQADLYAFYDHSKLPSQGAANYDLIYLGERIAGRFGPVLFEEEFIWQMGELFIGGQDRSSAAFQLALRLGTAGGPWKINAGVDMMSGDDDLTDDEVTTYRANYYFAHAYYGWMDYFVVNPAFGVVDYRLDGEVGFLKNAAGKPRAALKVQYHYFTPQNAPSAVDHPYGQEFDAELHLALYPKSNIVLGAALFLLDDSVLLQDRTPFGVGPGQDFRPGYFLYFMPVFNF